MDKKTVADVESIHKAGAEKESARHKEEALCALAERLARVRELHRHSHYPEEVCAVSYLGQWRLQCGTSLQNCYERLEERPTVWVAYCRVG